MNHRPMSRSHPSSFQQWMEAQKEAASGEVPAEDAQETSVFGQLFVIQENFTAQLQELSGSLPDAGKTISLSVNTLTRI